MSREIGVREAGILAAAEEEAARARASRSRRRSRGGAEDGAIAAAGFPRRRGDPWARGLRPLRSLRLRPRGLELADRKSVV